MANELVPHGVTLRAAVRWMDEQHKLHPDVPRWRLIEDAALHFDLSPVDERFLLHAFEAVPEELLPFNEESVS